MNTRMKLALLLPAVLTSAVASAAQPSVDLERVGKDISIMTQIIATAFKDGGVCRDCGENVSGKYLAQQGAVFTIHPDPGFLRFDLRRVAAPPAPPSPDDMEDIDLEFEAIADFAELPMIVNDALSRINIDINADGQELAMITSGYLDRETRQKLRDMEREMRRSEEQMRDVEIELIHADEKQRKALDGQLAEHRKKLEQLRTEKTQLDAIRKEKREEYQKQRETQRKELEARRAERMENLERVLFEAVCDYGSTMKNIPNDEKLSLVVERGTRFGGADPATIYVLTKKDVDSCSQGEWQKLKSKAIAYPF